MARKKKEAPVEAPEPMDNQIKENLVGEPIRNNQRVCWAIKTLVNEVHSVFPETPVEYSNYTARNVALDVAFDLTTIDADLRGPVSDVLDLLSLDMRVARAFTEEDQSMVSITSSPRTQDSREPFGVDAALRDILRDTAPAGEIETEPEAEEIETEPEMEDEDQ